MSVTRGIMWELLILIPTSLAIKNVVQCIVLIPTISITKALGSTTCISRYTHVQQLQSNEINEVDAALLKNLAADLCRKLVLYAANSLLM